jgi:hypothetical protein
MALINNVSDQLTCWDSACYGITILSQKFLWSVPRVITNSAHVYWGKPEKALKKKLHLLFSAFKFLMKFVVTV